MVFGENKIWISQAAFQCWAFVVWLRNFSVKRRKGLTAVTLIPVGCWKQAVSQAVRDYYFYYLITYLTLT